MQLSGLFINTEAHSDLRSRPSKRILDEIIIQMTIREL